MVIWQDREVKKTTACCFCWRLAPTASSSLASCLGKETASLQPGDCQPTLFPITTSHLSLPPTPAVSPFLPTLIFPVSVDHTHLLWPQTPQSTSPGSHAQPSPLWSTGGSNFGLCFQDLGCLAALGLALGSASARGSVFSCAPPDPCLHTRRGACISSAAGQSRAPAPSQGCRRGPQAQRLLSEPITPACF